MALNSALFVAFVCIVCLINYIFPRRVRYVWLLVCSYAFYLFPNAAGVDLTQGPKALLNLLKPEGFLQNLPAFYLMLLCVLISWLCSHFIESALNRWAKRIFLVISLLACLGMLLACKYLNFFLSAATLFGGSATHFSLIIPLGISYYTLQAVGYVVDVYTGTIKAERNPLRYALFVSFFPGIVTGPINRAANMLPQYKMPARFDYSRVAGGFFRVLWGLFKKMVIADNLGLYTSGILGGGGANATGPQLVLAFLLFSYQLYADFGGCCDIAIGTARMLGFDFAENFNRPFAAKTFTQLWQRWHISLTSFLRDYVFTPLVWSRWTEKIPFLGRFVKKPPTASSVVIIFLISGLWHGADINYVIWGMLNGLIMAAAKPFSKRREKIARAIPIYRARFVRGFFQRVFVYLMFTACLVFFAAGLFGRDVLGWAALLPTGWGAGLFGGLVSGLNAAGIGGLLLWALPAAMILCEVVEFFAVKPERDIALWVRSNWFFIRWPLYYLVLAALLAFGAFGSSPFIYMQY